MTGINEKGMVVLQKGIVYLSSQTSGSRDLFAHSAGYGILKSSAVLLMMLAFAGCVSTKPAELPAASSTIHVEIWRCCLCGGPTHSNAYEDLETKRTGNILFRGDFIVMPPDQNLNPKKFLAGNLPYDKKFLLDRIFYGIAYHRAADGGANYAKYRHGGLARFTMGSLQSGDLLVCYPEAF